MNNVPDSLWVVLHGDKYKLLIGCVYRAPSSTKETDALLAKSFAHASSFSANYKIIAGDFNLPEVNWLTSSGPQRFDELLATIDCYGWQQHVQTPTRGDNMLDLVFCHDTIPVSTYVGNRFSSSDHRMVLCSLPFSPLNTGNKQDSGSTICRSYKYTDWGLVQELIRLCQWDDYFTTDSLEALVTLFYRNVTLCLDTVAPKKIVKLSRHRTEYIPRAHRNKLRKLKKQYYSTKDISLLLSIHESLESLKRLRSQKDLDEELTALESTSKVYNLTALLKKRMQSAREIPYLLHDKVIYNEPATICELFSDWFANFSLETHMPGETAPLTISSLESIVFTNQLIVQAIKSLKPSTSTGPDGLASIIFKNSGCDIPLLLLKFFSISMDTGTYPSEWKTSFIIPHYKSGDRANVRNYRPINITPVISRIMEKVVKDQLSDYLIREDLVTRSQHGFLKNRSCVTCHFDFFNCITSSREARKLVVVLYFDISRAFDMVSHSILFEKLYSCGIRNPLLNWLKSFLSNRVQITKVGSVLSHPRQISSGVVQGSVLGPLLFTVYINSICKCFTLGKPFLYADDLKVVYSCYTHELSDMVTKIHLELSSLATWCAESCLNFNIDKCGWICIGNSNLDLTLEINGRKLAKLNSVVDLGIRYSSNLTFAEQTDYARRKTRRLIGCITRNFFCCETRVLLYKVCVRPILEYCPFILSGLRQNDKLKLEGVQRQFTSRTLGLESGLEYHERCVRLRLEPLWKRRLKLNLIFYYKLTNLLLHSSEPITKPTAVISYNLRNHHNLAAMEHCQTYVRYNFFLNKFSVIWNRLPANVRDANTLPVFISSVTRLLKDDNALLRLTLTPSFSPYIDILSSLNV
nr:unnamed protein product [Trichobilharzia regenti]CAH8838028.1 unnamed protein product [Trichobilharzia regenti]CAH8850437.1 unnamed protein product [Trichobilharzia regenti]CAH8867144.1 unnamed protein product [Trichobilharzia regenti]